MTLLKFLEELIKEQVVRLKLFTERDGAYISKKFKNNPKKELIFRFQSRHQMLESLNSNSLKTENL